MDVSFFARISQFERESGILSPHLKEIVILIVSKVTLVIFVTD